MRRSCNAAHERAGRLTGTVASGAKSSPLAHHQVPDRTTQSRSVSYQCGALMKPGCQRISRKYWPGADVLPNKSAESTEFGGKPAIARQAIWSGGVIIVIAGSTPAACAAPNPPAKAAIMGRANSRRVKNSLIASSRRLENLVTM
jgi:hypothetical protein